MIMHANGTNIHCHCWFNIDVTEKHKNSSSATISLGLYATIRERTIKIVFYYSAEEVIKKK